MFTGIIEEQGEIASVTRGSNSAVLSIKCSKVLENTKIGDSIAVNGVCLTVTTLHSDGYTADVMHETLDRSGLGRLKKGDRVNLERAMAADGRFGGHIVSGHIDGVGTIADISEDDNAVWFTVNASDEILRYVVEKGSIAIDGISLTVAYVDDTCFKVSTIPHTRKETNLAVKKAGDSVNLECDIIGKYVEKLMMPRKENIKTSNITTDFLAENGFI